MKRIAAVVLAMIISFISVGGSHILAENAAQPTGQPQTDTLQAQQSVIQPTAQKPIQPAKLINVQYSRTNGYEEVRIKAEGYTDYDLLELQNPLRIVVNL